MDQVDQKQSFIDKKTAEEMLQIQLTVDDSNDAFIGKTLGGIITSWNSGAERMFGYSAKEMIGKSISLLIPPEMKEELPMILDKIKKGESLLNYDSLRVRKDGSRIQVSLSISPVKNEFGVIIGAAIIERDILANKKEEEILRQIRLIVENSHDAIIGETLDGIVTSWNGGAERMFGYSSEEVTGKSIAFLLPPEIKSEVGILLNKIKAGQVVSDYDSVRVRKDGSKIEIALSISPLKAEDGTIIGASVVERDITARKKEEELMRQTHLIVENSYDAIISETLDGTITSWNGGAERMFGYSAKEMIGKSISLLLPSEMKEEMPVLLNKVKTGEVIADYDSVMLRKDGTRIDVAFSGSPIKTEEGIVTGVSVVERDITIRKKGEQHIKELDQIRNKFITIISHQLGTPLTSVNWNLETLLNGDFGKMEETQHKFLQATHLASVEITNRIHSLLTAMDIEEGRVVYDKGEVDLNGICAAVINERLKKCGLKNLSCVYTPPLEEIPSIPGDGQKIRMAISSLVENAINYSNEGGKVTASLQKKDGVVRFEISDKGVGIPATEQHLVFSRFFRASNASVMQQDAFGLGLFVAKNFIERHHGKIGFESKEGEGSTFWFEIPIKTGVEI